MPGALFKPGRLLACAAFLSLALLLTSCNAVFCFSTGPTIATVTPGSVLVAGTQVRLTIVGSNFDDGAFAVLSDGTQLQPESVNGSQMVIVVPAGQIVTPGTLFVRVSNPCGGFSNTFAVAVSF
jgi:hypothetical protein